MRAMPRTAYQLLDACVRIVAAVLLVAILVSAVTSTNLPRRLLSQGGALALWIPVTLAVVFALLLLVGRVLHPACRDLSRFVGVLLAVACLADGLTFFRHISAGRITSAMPVSLSLLLGVLLLLWAASKPKHRRVALDGNDVLWMKMADQAYP